MSDFLTDVQTLRKRAREHMDKGPITDAYGADRDRVIQVLNEVVATEIVCYLRYKRHYFTAKGLNAQAAEAEFLQHATDELGHADLAAGRITQLAFLARVGIDDEHAGLLRGAGRHHIAPHRVVGDQQNDLSGRRQAGREHG